jgi:hypothetical protein
MRHKKITHGQLSNEKKTKNQPLEKKISHGKVTHGQGGVSFYVLD